MGPAPDANDPAGLTRTLIALPWLATEPIFARVLRESDRDLGTCGTRLADFLQDVGRVSRADEPRGRVLLPPPPRSVIGSQRFALHGEEHALRARPDFDDPRAWHPTQNGCLADLGSTFEASSEPSLDVGPDPDGRPIRAILCRWLVEAWASLRFGDGPEDTRTREGSLLGLTGFEWRPRYPFSGPGATREVFLGRPTKRGSAWMQRLGQDCRPAPPARYATAVANGTWVRVRDHVFVLTDAGDNPYGFEPPLLDAIGLVVRVLIDAAPRLVSWIQALGAGDLRVLQGDGGELHDVIATMARWATGEAREPLMIVAVDGWESVPRTVIAQAFPWSQTIAIHRRALAREDDPEASAAAWVELPDDARLRWVEPVQAAILHWVRRTYSNAEPPARGASLDAVHLARTARDLALAAGVLFHEIGHIAWWKEFGNTTAGGRCSGPTFELGALNVEYEFRESQNGGLSLGNNATKHWVLKLLGHALDGSLRKDLDGAMEMARVTCG